MEGGILNSYLHDLTRSKVYESRCVSSADALSDQWVDHDVGCFHVEVSDALCVEVKDCAEHLRIIAAQNKTTFFRR